MVDINIKYNIWKCCRRSFHSHANSYIILHCVTQQECNILKMFTASKELGVFLLGLQSAIYLKFFYHSDFCSQLRKGENGKIS